MILGLNNSLGMAMSLQLGTDQVSPIERSEPLLASQGSVRIASLDGPREVVGRLKSLGFCPGQMVRVVRRSDPAVIEVLGTHIGMSAEVARHISVCRS